MASNTHDIVGIVSCNDYTEAFDVAIMPISSTFSLVDVSVGDVRETGSMVAIAHVFPTLPMAIGGLAKQALRVDIIVHLYLSPTSIPN